MQKHSFFLLLLAAALGFQCERPCPADIDLGEIDLSPATKSFLPDAQKVQEMTFKNATGEKLVFKNTNPDWQKRTQQPVETLCQKGDFLTGSSQVKFFDAESIHFYYTSTAPDYTLEITSMHFNAGTYGAVADTAFYETFTAYGQRIAAPTQVGGTTVLTSLRGNEAKIDPNLVATADNFVFVADTSLLGQPIKNAWVTPTGKNWSLFVFYTKERGIEAFTTQNGEVWLRQ